MHKRSKLRLVGVLVVAVALVCVGASGATVLPPSNNALPGSSFQGADGNQDDAAPLIDWQAMQRAGRVYHNPDPNALDSIFTGGSKENEPGEWGLTTQAGGANPGKSNIFDAWSAADQSGGDVFLYLGFTRQDATGTSYLAFELNHDARLWNNGNANIPCRHTGDILVSYQAEGNDVDVIVQRWRTIDSDPGTTCATTGELQNFTGFTPNVDAQGGINDAAIAARLPGFYDDEVPRHHFGEAALNLSEILDDGFDDPCFSFGAVWMHSRSSTSPNSSMQDYVAPTPISVRSCSASGTKFHDLNGNGQRDRGEPGLARWLIWADYDNDGIHDRGEPFGITDEDGHYVINDIRPPRGTYMLRETIATARGRRRAAAADITCSFPNDGTRGGTGSAPGGLFPCAWGPISTATTTNARGRDFGNFQPAQLIVRKELAPPSDPGRFDLRVNGRVALPAAGDGASRTLTVNPGSYTVSETAAAGTNASNYVSSVGCKLEPRRRRVRSAPTYTQVLRSGERAVCTFWNARAPLIAIDKAGPSSALAGSTLEYTLYVANPGTVPFPAANVKVTDPGCDHAPELSAKTGPGGGPDSSPGTLDHGDTWTYRCSRKTDAPGDDCVVRVVPNTATVTGSANGITVGDNSTISTTLLCPPPPGPGPGPEPPEPPTPIEPPGPPPPEAGEAARAALRTIVGRCVVGRTGRVTVRGARIARVRMYVNGELQRTYGVRPLQQRLTRRVRLAHDRRTRVTAHITFEPGSGNPSVTLTRVIRACVLARVHRVPFTG